ncbi:MAG: VWA domain-containing protein, partial [Hyphomicrobiales bacterium]
MDTRISLGLGTAAVALLVLPLGYQLYTSTAITPIGVPPAQPPVQTASQPAVVVAADEARQRVVSPTEETNGAALQNASPAPEAAPLVQSGGAAVAAQKSAAPGIGRAAAEREAPADALASSSGAFAPATEMLAMPAPAPSIAAPMEPSGDVFTAFNENPVKIVRQEPVSTFSIDVDTASYAYVRQALNDGWLPEPDAVRIEEMINYFTYDYPAPDTAETPFRATMQIYPTPWNAKTQLLQIGVKGYVPPVTEDKASNLVFLLDTSGSMDEPNKLPLLKRAFGLLVDQLGANDTVSIVAYAGSAGVVLEPTRATDKAKIMTALETLSAGGSTAGADGIELAYRLAEQNMVDGGINRVILATDGDFNVGIDDPEELKSFIKAKRDEGVFLSVLGFGQGNYGDDTMQALAQNGNGNASYIDSFREAQKVLVQEMGGTLETIAKDVKIQVEFNPATVAEYRLVGYETRALNREDFNNDKVDAGDIGAGHTVTAIYEITPVGSGAELNDPLRYGTDTPAAAVLPSDEIGFLKMRYKAPEGGVSKLIETPIT